VDAPTTLDFMLLYFKVIKIKVTNMLRSYKTHQDLLNTIVLEAETICQNLLRALLLDPNTQRQKPSIVAAQMVQVSLGLVLLQMRIAHPRELMYSQQVL
jgi:hypothetical protein